MLFRSGIDKIRAACLENDTRFPEFEFDPTGLMVEFKGRVPERRQNHIETSAENGTKSALSRHQVDILRKCITDRRLKDMMAVAGRSDRTKFRNQVLNPLIDCGFIEMTIPDKPRSSKQKYRLTEQGKKLLKTMENE